MVFRHSSGQALLIVLVSLAAVITVALSVVARSITDLRNVSKEEDALRSFSAAEAGVERALVTDNNGQTVTITDNGNLENATFEATVSDFAQGSTQFAHPKELLSGESASVWFISHDEDGNYICSGSQPCFRGSRMRVCWGDSGTSSNSSTTPAVQVTVYYDPNANGNWNDVRVARAAYDPNGGRRGGNSFAAPDGGTCTINGQNFQFQKTIQFGTDLAIPAAAFNNQNGLLMARVKLLYNTTEAHNIGTDVSGSGGLLPGQGKRIESTGSSGESNRKVEVYTLFPDLPAIFDSAIFSPVAITK